MLEELVLGSDRIAKVSMAVGKYGTFSDGYIACHQSFFRHLKSPKQKRSLGDLISSFIKAVYSNGDVRTHNSANTAAGAFISFLFIDLGRDISHAVDMGSGSENFFGAEGNAEMATFTPFGVYHDIAGFEFG